MSCRPTAARRVRARRGRLRPPQRAAHLRVGARQAAAGQQAGGEGAGGCSIRLRPGKGGGVEDGTAWGRAGCRGRRRDRRHGGDLTSAADGHGGGVEVHVEGRRMKSPIGPSRGRWIRPRRRRRRAGRAATGGWRPETAAGDQRGRVSGRRPGSARQARRWLKCCSRRRSRPRARRGWGRPSKGQGRCRPRSGGLRRRG